MTHLCGTALTLGFEGLSGISQEFLMQWTEKYCILTMHAVLRTNSNEVIMLETFGSLLKNNLDKRVQPSQSLIQHDLCKTRVIVI